MKKAMTPKGLTAMVGLRALPGTIKYDGMPFTKITELAVNETKKLYAAGIRNIMLQNVSDLPMLEKVGPEVTAYMSAVGYAMKMAVPEDCSLGVSVLKNDGAATVAVAEAMGADYVRAKVYVGAMVSASGIECGCVDEVLAMRYKLGSSVQIWADVHDRVGTPLANVSLLDDCGLAIDKGLADALIICGKNFDESIEMIDSVKAAFPNQYVFIGGGSNPDNMATIYKHCEGIIVGSYLKEDGKIYNELDDKRLSEFMSVYDAL